MTEQPRPPVRYHGRAIALVIGIFAAVMLPMDLLTGQGITWWTLFKILLPSALILAWTYVKLWREGRL